MTTMQEMDRGGTNNNTINTDEYGDTAMSGIFDGIFTTAAGTAQMPMFEIVGHGHHDSSEFSSGDEHEHDDAHASDALPHSSTIRGLGGSTATLTAAKTAANTTGEAVANSKRKRPGGKGRKKIAIRTGLLLISSNEMMSMLRSFSPWDRK